MKNLQDAITAIKKLQETVKVLSDERETKRTAARKKKLLATYVYCDSCQKNRPPKGFQTFNVGPCGLTDYYRDETVCARCVPSYNAHYKRR